MCDPANPCSGKKPKIVDLAFKQAKAWLPRARKAMAAYIKNPQNPRSKRVADALSEHFNWVDGVSNDSSQGGMFPDVPGDIIRTIDLIRDKMDDPHEPNCLGSGRDLTPDDELITVLARFPPGGSGNCFSYTDEYFSQTSTTQARIVIHEMMHSWANMDDVFYEGKEGYPGNFRQADNNADSYAALIRDLATKKK